MTFLQENSNRFVILPIQHNDIWKSYKGIEAKFFTAEDVNMHEDSLLLRSSLNIYTQQSICNILSLEGYNQIIKLIMSITAQCQIPEARCYFSFLQMMFGIYYEIISTLQHDIFALKPNCEIQKYQPESFIEEYILLLIILDNIMSKISVIGVIHCDRVMVFMNNLLSSTSHAIQVMCNMYLHYIDDKDKLTIERFEMIFNGNINIKEKLYNTTLTKISTTSIQNNKPIFTTDEDF
jgi:hypothetical protein